MVDIRKGRRTEFVLAKFLEECVCVFVCVCVAHKYTDSSNTHLVCWCANKQTLHAHKYKGAKLAAQF